MTERRQPSHTWTREQTLEHCKSRTLTNVENLSHIAGSGPNVIYEEIKSGRWTATRVHRIGRKILIPTADILAWLGLDHGDSPTGAPRASVDPPLATSDAELRDAQ